MTGVLDGVVVLDLSRGSRGRSRMLLADHGAQVTKIEPPGGDPTVRTAARGVAPRASAARCSTPTTRRIASGSCALASQRRRARRELRARHRRAARDRPRHAARAQPAPRVLLDHRVRRRRRARRPAGGRRARRGAHRPPMGEPRRRRRHHRPPGRRRSGVPRPRDARRTAGSARRDRARSSRRAVGQHGRRLPRHARDQRRAAVREQTGRGQRVDDVAAPGCARHDASAWQRVEHADAPDFQSWIIDQRAPKGVFRCADGRWIQQWVPLPEFVLAPSEGDTLESHDGPRRPATAPTRIGLDASEIVLLHHYHPMMAEAVAKFPTDEWVARAPRSASRCSRCARPKRRCRPGAPRRRVRHRGRRSRARTAAPGRARLRARTCVRPRRHRAGRRPGQHTDDVRAEADAAAGCARSPHAAPRAAPASPLEGDPRARPRARGRRSVGNAGARRPRRRRHQGQHVARRLLDQRRTSRCAATGASAASPSTSRTPTGWRCCTSSSSRPTSCSTTCATTPPCASASTTRSLARSSPTSSTATRAGSSRRARAPARQRPDRCRAGRARLARRRARPDGIAVLAVISLGDTGNGFLSAIGDRQALYHRDRTGEGQFVDTSIIYAQLLNASMAWITPDGSRHGRPSQRSTGCSSVGSRCTACTSAPTAGCASPRSTTSSAAALGVVLGVDSVGDDAAFGAIRVGVRARPRGSGSRASTPPACRRGVDPDFVLGLFDDPEMIEGMGRGVPTPDRGRDGAVRSALRLRETPGVVQGPPLMPG